MEEFIGYVLSGIVGIVLTCIYNKIVQKWKAEKIKIEKKNLKEKHSPVNIALPGSIFCVIFVSYNIENLFLKWKTITYPRNESTSKIKAFRENP
ncbi:MAG: hypothetical protein Q4C77_19565 [Eubacteriales bacterium]|nr:hypothetical protein [Eubacteriales bacterium]